MAIDTPTAGPASTVPDWRNHEDPFGTLHAFMEGLHARLVALEARFAPAVASPDKAPEVKADTEVAQTVTTSATTDHAAEATEPAITEEHAP